MGWFHPSVVDGFNLIIVTNKLPIVLQAAKAGSRHCVITVDETNIAKRREECRGAAYHHESVTAAAAAAAWPENGRLCIAMHQTVANAQAPPQPTSVNAKGQMPKVLTQLLPICVTQPVQSSSKTYRIHITQLY